MCKFPNITRKVYKCWVIRVTEGPNKKRPGGVCLERFYNASMINKPKENIWNLFEMLRMNYWRTTGLQRVAKYVRPYLIGGGGGGGRNPIPSINYLERSRRLSWTNLEEFLLIHQLKLLPPNPKSLDFQRNFLGLCVAHWIFPEMRLHIAYPDQMGLNKRKVHGNLGSSVKYL